MLSDTWNRLKTTSDDWSKKMRPFAQSTNEGKRRSTAYFQNILQIQNTHLFLFWNVMEMPYFQTQTHNTDPMTLVLVWNKEQDSNRRCPLQNLYIFKFGLLIISINRYCFAKIVMGSFCVNWWSVKAALVLAVSESGVCLCVCLCQRRLQEHPSTTSLEDYHGVCVDQSWDVVGVDAESVGGHSFPLKPARAKRVACSDFKGLFLRHVSIRCGRVSWPQTLGD